jgi:hypothetical protein
MDHEHMDLFHVNGTDYYAKEFVGRQMKKGVLANNATWMKTTLE